MMLRLARPWPLPRSFFLWLLLSPLSIGASACASTPAPPPRSAQSSGPVVPPAPAATSTLVNETPGRLRPDQIRRAVMAHAAEVRTCYDDEARMDPALQGQIVLSWDVLPDGSVSAPMIFRATLDNARVEECVLRQVRGWRFPASNSQTTVDSFPFRFPG
jgi:outer membrane biosynthesis protein TonB